MMYTRWLIACILAYAAVGILPATSQENAEAITSTPAAEDTHPSISNIPLTFPFDLGLCEVGGEPFVGRTQKEQAIQWMQGNIHYWGRGIGFWTTTYWFVLGLSFLASFFAGSGLLPERISIKGRLDANTRSLPLRSTFALVAAIATSFLATFNPQAQAEKYKTAFTYMKVAVAMYMFDPRMTRCHLTQAYATAESIVQRSASPSASLTAR